MSQNQVSMEMEKLELKRRQVEAAEKYNETAQFSKDQMLSETFKENESKRNASVAKAKSKYSNTLDDVKELEGEISEVEDWSKESDLSIGRAMRNCKSCKECFIATIVCVMFSLRHEKMCKHANLVCGHF